MAKSQRDGCQSPLHKDGADGQFVLPKIEKRSSSLFPEVRRCQEKLELPHLPSSSGLPKASNTRKGPLQLVSERFVAAKQNLTYKKRRKLAKLSTLADLRQSILEYDEYETHQRNAAWKKTLWRREDSLISTYPPTFCSVLEQAKKKFTASEPESIQPQRLVKFASLLPLDHRIPSPEPEKKQESSFELSKALRKEFLHNNVVRVTLKPISSQQSDWIDFAYPGVTKLDKIRKRDTAELPSIPECPSDGKRLNCDGSLAQRTRPGGLPPLSLSNRSVHEDSPFSGAVPPDNSMISGADSESAVLPTTLRLSEKQLRELAYRHGMSSLRQKLFRYEMMSREREDHPGHGSLLHLDPSLLKDVLEKPVSDCDSGMEDSHSLSFVTFEVDSDGRLGLKPMSKAPIEARRVSRATRRLQKAVGKAVSKRKSRVKNPGIVGSEGEESDGGNDVRECFREAGAPAGSALLMSRSGEPMVTVILPDGQVVSLPSHLIQSEDDGSGKGSFVSVKKEDTPGFNQDGIGSTCSDSGVFESNYHNGLLPLGASLLSTISPSPGQPGHENGRSFPNALLRRGQHNSNYEGSFPDYEASQLHSFGQRGTQEYGRFEDGSFREGLVDNNYRGILPNFSGFLPHSTNARFQRDDLSVEMVESRAGSDDDDDGSDDDTDGELSESEKLDKWREEFREKQTQKLEEEWETYKETKMRLEKEEKKKHLQSDTDPTVEVDSSGTFKTSRIQNESQSSERRARKQADGSVYKRPLSRSAPVKGSVANAIESTGSISASLSGDYKGVEETGQDSSTEEEDGVAVGGVKNSGSDKSKALKKKKNSTLNGNKNSRARNKKSKGKKKGKFHGKEGKLKQAKKRNGDPETHLSGTSDEEGNHYDETTVASRSEMNSGSHQMNTGNRRMNAKSRQQKSKRGSQPEVTDGSRPTEGNDSAAEGDYPSDTLTEATKSESSTKLVSDRKQRESKRLLAAEKRRLEVEIKRQEQREAKKRAAEEEEDRAEHQRVEEEERIQRMEERIAERRRKVREEREAREKAEKEADERRQAELRKKDRLRQQMDEMKRKLEEEISRRREEEMKKLEAADREAAEEEERRRCEEEAKLEWERRIHEEKDEEKRRELEAMRLQEEEEVRQQEAERQKRSADLKERASKLEEERKKALAKQTWHSETALETLRLMHELNINPPFTYSYFSLQPPDVYLV
eukprot:m.64156 g.64156  ORF g.64156 m.64156 type:complete len:1199 (+) comp35225_c0_seq3:98-3694(+)